MAKCLTGRPKTVEKAQAVFMLWVELEAVDNFLVLALSLSLSIMMKEYAASNCFECHACFFSVWFTKFL